MMREGAVHVLCALFGMASWLVINGVWVELPLLVTVLPESWNLASQMSILLQCANIGPLIVTLMDVYCQKKMNIRALIYSLLMLGFAAQLLLYFFWDTTVNDVSVPFFILFFASSLVDCTSSVSFIPYMSQLKTMFLQSYFLGEGLSGFVPAVVSIIQGVGETTCLITENGTIPIYHDPRFDVGTFWLVLASMMLVSFISFFIINVSCEQYFVNYSISSIGKSEVSDSYSANRDDIQFDMELPQQDTSPVSELEDDIEDDIEEIEVSANNPRWNLLYLSLFLICLMANGFLPAISTFTSMPYGIDAFHVSTILLTLANPIACVVAYFRPITQPRYIFVTIGLSFVLAGYNIFLALGSPCPVLVDSVIGSTIMVISTTLYTFLTTLAKVSFANMLRNNATTRHLLWFGAVTQIGSFCGAVISYPLVNNLGIFTPRFACQPCI